MASSCSKRWGEATGTPRLILTKRIPLSPPPYPSPPTTPGPSSKSWRSRSSSPPNTSPSPPLSSSSDSWRSRHSFSSSSSSSSSSLSSSPSLKSQNSWETTNNWRSGSPPKSLDKPVTTPDFDELTEGQVLYLGVPPPGSIFWQRRDVSSPEGHPVVVVGKYWGKDGEECVKLRLVTSFGGQRLQDKKPYWQWKFFMLCENSQEQAKTDKVRLAKVSSSCDTFKKRCYINLSLNSLYHIEYRHLGLFATQPNIRFDSLSTSEIKNSPANC